MIVVDYSQICIASYMQAARQYNDPNVDIEAFRHIVLNSIRAINMKFRAYTDYSRLVFAVDSPKSWRKQIFPYYKMNREVDKKKSAVDWSQLYACIKQVQSELMQHFPFQVIQIKHAEADDIIASIAKSRTAQNLYTLIVSGDKDFVQLQIDNQLVRQYDNVNDRYITVDDPKRYKFEHVIRGDRGDGVPNILSEDNCLVAKIRQKKVMTKTLDQWWEEGIDFTVVDKVKLNRNITLIDLNKTPKPIYDQVIDQINSFEPKKRIDLLSYFASNNLKQLANNLGDFK
ncbi:ribonuclease H protein [Rhizobium phage RHph_I1_18]|nr:ribonuclease H protein [Rhizobium phage RHph_I1_18]